MFLKTKLMTVNKKMVNKNIFFEFQNLEVYKSIIIQYSLQKITKKKTDVITNVIAQCKSSTLTNVIAQCL